VHGRARGKKANGASADGLVVDNRRAVRKPCVGSQLSPSSFVNESSLVTPFSCEENVRLVAAPCGHRP